MHPEDYQAYIRRYSSDPDVFIATAPELPGCMSHGSSQEEALGNLRDAIAEWIDTCESMDRPVPLPRVIEHHLHA